MHDLEDEIFSKIDFEVIAYSRYVDDTFAVLHKNNVCKFVECFNQYHQRLNFTIEKEINNKLSFLDVSIIKDDNGNIKTDWYNKKTYSGRYINFLSNHSLSTKIGRIKNLVDRIIKFSDNSFHDKNM